MRLHSAVISRVWSPSTSSPIGLSTTISIRAASAESRVRPSASSTTSSMATRDSSGSPSAPVSRDSAISSVTRLPEPVRLADDLGAEPADLGGVVGGVEHGLGEQPDRADRRLELVADVGHEVAAGGLQPHGVGRVGGLDHRVAVAERAHAARARRRVGGRAGRAATGRRRPPCRAPAPRRRPRSPGRRACRRRRRPARGRARWRARRRRCGRRRRAPRRWRRRRAAGGRPARARAARPSAGPPPDCGPTDGRPRCPPRARAPRPAHRPHRS